MSHWQSAPDASSRTQNFRIFRTPANKLVEMVCLSQAFIGAKLHFWKGRTKPCCGTNCPACAEGQRPRWKGYVLAYHQPTRTIVIFEFTDRAHQAFHEATVKHRHLRGMKFTTSRLNKKVNGPLRVEFTDIREESPHLPAEVDLMDMLERIWEIRQQDLPFESSLPHNA